MKLVDLGIGDAVRRGIGSNKIACDIETGAPWRGLRQCAGRAVNYLDRGSHRGVPDFDRRRLKLELRGCGSHGKSHPLASRDGIGPAFYQLTQIPAAVYSDIQIQRASIDRLLIRL
jgi:hypothetical protein